jgi:hypothetical protein
VNTTPTQLEVDLDKKIKELETKNKELLHQLESLSKLIDNPELRKTGCITDGSEEDSEREDFRAHIIAEDPRYPLLCINGKFTYGMRMNPDTGNIDPTKLCICAARGDEYCICNLK